MSPLAAIYRPGGADPNGYPVTVVAFITNWSEASGAVTQVVCVATDGAIRMFPTEQVQIVDRTVAVAMAAATEIHRKQRGPQGTVPPQR